MIYVLLFLFFLAGLLAGAGAITPVVMYIAVPCVCVTAIVLVAILSSSSKDHYTTEHVLELINRAITYLHEETLRK